MLHCTRSNLGVPVPLKHNLSSHWLALAAIAGLFNSAASAQDRAIEPLSLVGISPAGLRNTVTESWGTLRVEIANSGAEDRRARVVAFYPAKPDVQFARDIFVPARTAAVSWLTVGPALEGSGSFNREIEILLYDRTGGRERLILPKGVERLRSENIFYARREPTTAILMDQEEIDPATNATNSHPDTDEVMLLALCMRDAAGLSEKISVIHERFLPTMHEAFDGIDVLILASNRLSSDPAGRQAIRRWVQQGGNLWVLLDRVNCEETAHFLGDEFDLEAIDRIGLTTVLLHRSSDDPSSAEARNFDNPVEFSRLTIGNDATSSYTANGWPAAFTRTLGLGRITFTTLGPRGWYRPRTFSDQRSRFEHYPDLPIALDALGNLAVQFHPRAEPPRPPNETLNELLLREVGYSVVSRRMVGTVFGLFVLALIVLGIGLRWTSKPERIGWLGPIVAILAATAFAALGEASRSSVPPTIGVAEIVDVVPGNNEAATYGVFAVYHPTSGPVMLGTNMGATLNLDSAGLEGKTRQRVVNDLNNWHWEGLSLPAGLRTGTLQSIVQAPKLAAVAHFESNGVHGMLNADSFRNAADGLIITPTHEPLPVRFISGNTFIADDSGLLPHGQYLAGVVLSDRQQLQQSVYRQLLDNRWPRHWEGRNVLLAWAEPDELPFSAGEGVRKIGASLLAVPLEFERIPAGTQVAIPRPFVTYARLLGARLREPQMDGSNSVEMHLRFQLPATLLPFSVERVLFHAKARTPGRHLIVTGIADADEIPLYDAENPLDPIRLELSDPRLLRLDPDGGLHIKLKIGEPTGKPTEKGGAFEPPSDGKGKSRSGKKFDAPAAPNLNKEGQPILTSQNDLAWRIESLGVEVSGRTRHANEK